MAACAPMMVELSDTSPVADSSFGTGTWMTSNGIPSPPKAAAKISSAKTASVPKVAEKSDSPTLCWYSEDSRVSGRVATCSSKSRNKGANQVPTEGSNSKGGSPPTSEASSCTSSSTPGSTTSPDSPLSFFFSFFFLSFFLFPSSSPSSPSPLPFFLSFFFLSFFFFLSSSSGFGFGVLDEGLPADVSMASATCVPACSAAASRLGEARRSFLPSSLADRAGGRARGFARVATLGREKLLEATRMLTSGPNFGSRSLRILL
mmetsp:Transcript_25874/g.60592  ORF Transcript_25874/g.60592 Transcript_25874/m.60592 type:complete len:261 (+) Transcript_25874:1065-1847(+)